MPDNARVALLTANSESIFYVRELRKHIEDSDVITLDKLKSVLSIAAQSKYGDFTGRFLGNWDWGFDEGQKATIKAICEGLGVPIPANHKRLSILSAPDSEKSAADCPCQSWPVASIRDPFLTSERHHEDCDGTGERKQDG
jgi:hypothetical protein